ncbi:MAG: hypothetical protein GY761_04655 [Hyphomicrobiales bacterium]|nr:hypothetical protein [Hyphomicrobiales bacterium]
MNSAEATTIDRGELINDLANMIRIPSVNRFREDDPLHPAEAAMANYFEKRLSELGSETSSQDLSAERRNVHG